MEIKEAVERCNELIKEKHANWIGLISQEAILTVLQEIEHLQKENEELKAKQVMQEFKIDWCEKNTIKKCEIKAIFSTYEARREQGEAVIGYWVLKDFVKKLLGEK